MIYFLLTTISIGIYNYLEWDTKGMAVEQQLLITEDQVIVPAVKILEEVSIEPPRAAQPKEVSQSLQESLDNLFPEQHYEEKDIQKAKEILGELSNEFTPEQLKGALIEIEYLAQSWLDDLERDIFKGLTLKEVLHEKGSI